jgi:hypothetical protein
MEFKDFGQATVNAIIYFYFSKLFVKMRLAISFVGV